MWLLLLLGLLLVQGVQAATHSPPPFRGLFSDWTGGTLAVVFLVLAVGFCAAGVAAVAQRGRPWFI